MLPVTPPGGYPTGPPVPSRTAPIWTIVVGLLAGVTGFALLLVGAVGGLTSAAEAVANQQRLGSGIEHRLAVEPGGEYAVFVGMDLGVACEASTADGAPASIRSPKGSLTINNRVLALVIEAPDAGDSMLLTCVTSDGTDFFFGDHTAAAFGGAPSMAIGGIALMGIGFVLTVAGIIWLAIRSSKIKAMRELGGGY